MSTIVIAFLVGVTATGVVSYAICRKLKNERSLYEDEMGVQREIIRNHELGKAYQDGRQYEIGQQQARITALIQQIEQLQAQNVQLCDELGTESIFAHAVATNGGAAVRLRSMQKGQFNG